MCDSIEIELDQPWPIWALCPVYNGHVPLKFWHRFWSYVDKTPGHGPNGDCWLWTGGRSGSGYGSFRYADKMWPAHRFIYWAAYGPFDLELDILHKCDTPACVRPSHLEPGTAEDNMLDMVQKGRNPSVVMGKKWAEWARGSKSKVSKLSEADIPEIRRRIAAGDSQRKIAKAFGVNRRTINKINYGITWGHVK
jgi:hypothetical protein